MNFLLGLLHYYFAGLWPLLWHFGIGGVVVLACVLLYLFTPTFLSTLFPRVQVALIWVASVTLAAMIFTAIGVSIGEKRIHAQWDAASLATLENTKQVRASAVRTVTRKPSRWVRHSQRDPDLRD